MSTVGPKLIDMINSKTAQDIDFHLRKLPVEQLSTEIADSDAKGMTPLHLAIEKADVEMTKVLLSFDAPVGAKKGQKSPEDYAKELMGSQPQDARKRVYALIKSRGRWQGAAAQQGIIFSRSMKAIEEAVDKIQGALGNSGVLFLGITGEGKSTFINYLCGTDYKLEKVKRARKVVPTSPEAAAVGHSPTSFTILPQIIKMTGKPYVLVDLPGFEDTRGTAEEICAAASICMLTKQLKLIQSIPFAVSWPTLADARMVSYRKAAENVGAMISHDPKTAENVILVVTKPEEDLAEDEIRERLEELVKAEGWQGKAPDGVKREDLNDDMWKKHCLRKTTEAILGRQGNIVIGDVVSKEARDAFQNVVDKLEKKAKDPKQFDFNSYSKYMKQFQIVVEGMIVHFNALTRGQKSLEEILKSLESRIAETDGEMKALEESIAKYEKQKLQPFTEDSFNQKIAEEKEKLRDLRKNSQTLKDNLTKAEFDAKIKVAKFESIEKEGERVIDTVHQGWVCEKTEDRVETKVTYKEKRFVPGLGEVQFVDIKEEKVAGQEKTVSESVSYPSTVPIKRYVDMSHGGHFEAKGFTAGAMQIAGTFVSTPGVRGGVGLNIQLWGDTKDFPDAKDKLNRLQQELKDAERELDTAKKQSIPEDEIEAASERVKKIELEKISAVGDHKRTQEICEMQIQFLRTQIDKTQIKLDELKPQGEAHKTEIADLKLQLEVNKDLFTKLKMIIEAMEFKGDLIEQFIKLF